ncbi:DEAD/DEAH box helicase [Eupransor demetentiae]
MANEEWYGRRLVVPKIDYEATMGEASEAIVKGNCTRCGQKNLFDLPRGEQYCRACLNLGRVSTLDYLVSQPERHAFVGQALLTWQGQLTEQQTAVSQELIASLEAGRDHLVWAVTGAGKTEMLFPLILKALQSRRRVALVSPRLDVINELAPRIKAAFEATDLIVLHGQTEEPYRYTQLVLATTHQLLRFYQAFDLIIVDEVDAFPFRGDPTLAYALQNARLSDGTVVYLTATPTPDLLRQHKRGQLACSYLPLRFHQHLLPELKIKRVGNWRKGAPGHLLKCLREFQQQQQRFLIFVPKITDLALVQKYLADFPAMVGTTVYAADPDRIEKVTKMRNGEYQYLITTTILERGVTLPGIDVLILGADDPVFSANALVQMAGRVGRKANRPDGLVQAYCQQMTWPVWQARKQIQDMNRRGQKLKGEE